MKIDILGCGGSFLPVIMETIHETLGSKHFRVFKNIIQKEAFDIAFKPSFFSYELFESSQHEIPNGPFVFGVPGPFAKFTVYNYFLQKYRIQLNEYTLITHPKSFISLTAIISNAVFVEAGVNVSSQAKLGFGVTIKGNSYIGHHTEIHDFAEINPGVTIGGKTIIGRGSIIGGGSTISNNITIGDNSYIGLGSVVTKDIPSGVIAYGNPCKPIRENDKWKI